MIVGDQVMAKIGNGPSRPGKIVRIHQNGPKNKNPLLYFVEHDDGSPAMYYRPDQFQKGGQ